MAKGWLDNYNDSKASAPEGFQGDGYSNVGRNYSPAWGGQFQEGGEIAQTGKKVKFNVKQFLKDNNKNISPQQKKINVSTDKEQRSEDYRRWYDTKEYKDNVKSNKAAEDKATIQDRKDRINKSMAAQNKSFTKDNWRKQLADETQAIGDKFRMFPEDPDSFVDEWLNPGVMIGNMASDLGSAPLRAQQENSYMPYVTGVGVPLLTGGLEGLGTTSNKQFVNNLVNPLNIVPGYHSAEKAISKTLGTESGLLSNAYKLNPFAGKLGRYNRIVGNNAIDDLNASGLVRAGNKGGRNNMTLHNVSFNRTTPYPSFGEGIPAADNVYAQSIVNQGNKPYIISTNREFAPSTLGRHGKGSTMFPIDDTGKYLESFPASEVNVFEATKPHWLQGYKEVPKQEDGGIIKDDRGQWDHPGEITEIGSNDITMEGVPYDVLGVSDTGDTKLMKPGKNYKFKGKKVTEYPMAKNGLRQEQKGLQNLDQLTNFTNYNTKQPGGWMDQI